MAEGTLKEDIKPGGNEGRILPRKVSQTAAILITGSLAASMGAACVPEKQNTETPNPSNSPTTEFSPNPTAKSETPTPYVTYTETAIPTPTEAPRFTNLVPNSIEEAMQDNVLDISTPEKIASEVALLREKMMTNIPPIEECSTYKIKSNGGGYPAMGFMDVGDMVIENPKVAAVASEKGNGTQFLSIGIWLRDRWDPNKCFPIIFTFDTKALQGVDPSVTDPAAIENWKNTMDPFYNNENIYKKLISGDVKEMRIIVCKSLADEKSVTIDKNLLWLFNKEHNLPIPVEYVTKKEDKRVNITSKFEWFLGRFANPLVVKPESFGEDIYKDSTNSLEAMSYSLVPSRYLVINSYTDTK